MSNQIILNGEPPSGEPSAVACVPRIPDKSKDRLDNTEVSFIELWRILRKRKWVIVMCVGGLFALAVASTITTTPKYQATSTIEFNRGSSDILSLTDTRAMLGDASAMDYHVTQRTQVNALQSDTLALRVVHDLGLEKRQEFVRRQSLTDLFRKFPDESGLPLEQATHRRANVLKAFHKNLRVELVPGTRMIKIRFLNPDPQTSAAVANALVDAYLEQYFRIRYQATLQATAWLSKQLEDLRGEVETSQQKLVNYQKQVGILGTDEAHNIVMTRLEGLDRQVMLAQANRILAQTVWQLAKSGNPELISGLVGSSVGMGSVAMPNSMATIQDLRAKQSQIKLEYAEAAAKYGSAYPKLIQLKSQLSAIDDTIQVEIERLASRAQNDYTAAQQAENALRASFEKVKAEANQLNDDAVQYSILKHEAESNRELYDNLSRQLKEAGVLAGLKSSNIVTVDPARPVDRPAKPFVLLNLAVGLFAGLLVGVGGAFVVENFDETINTPGEVEQVAMLQSLGMVPRSKALSAKTKDPRPKRATTSTLPVLVASQPHSQIAEAYRSIRTSIVQATRRDQNNVLLFTSALPEEGKTTTVLNCGGALAQQGTSVLVVEADLRRSKLSRQLNLADSVGLSSLSQGGSTAGLPVKVPSIPNLSVIPAGPKASYPAELLGSPRMAELIQQWRAEFNYVLIDTPPVLSVTDAVALSPCCDAVVVVVRSGVTRKQSLLRVRDIFARARVRILGAIINDFDLKSADHYRYFGYEHGRDYTRGYYTPEAN